MTPEPHPASVNDASLDEMQRVVDALYRVHGLHASITDLDGLLAAIIEESKAVAAAEAGSLLLYDQTLDELYFHVALGDSGDHQALKDGLRLKLGEGIAGTAAATRETVNVENASTDPRANRTADKLTQFETRSLLAVPLVDNDELIGVLEVLNKEGGGSFSDLDRRVMEMFSSHAASVITRARLLEENVRAERLAAVGQAVAGLSHYTKNIINGMLASVELVDEGFTGENDMLVEKGWPILKRSVSRLTHVVEDMLAFSKPREPLYEPCTLPRLVEEAAESFRELFEQRQVELAIEYEGVDEKEQIWLDTRGVHRALLNLLTNAGDVVESGAGRIRIRVEKSGEHLVLEVSDNGPGVPEENRHRMFDAFFSTKGSKGTGLGLAVTSKIISEHGGTIEVDTDDLGGACFRLHLPIDNTREQG